MSDKKGVLNELSSQGSRSNNGCLDRTKARGLLKGAKEPRWSERIQLETESLFNKR
jgi:hypothetical protein